MTLRIFWICLILLAPNIPAGAQVKFELKRKENTNTSYATTRRLHQILTINGIDLESGSEETSLSQLAVGTRRADGSLPVVRKIENLKVKIELPMGLGFSFDSKNPDADIPANPAIAKLHQAVKTSSGLTYTEILDKDGRLVAIEGADKSIDDVKDVPADVKDTIKTRLSTESMTKTYKQAYDMLPTTLVNKGETWERSEFVDIGSGQILTFKKRYEYLGTEEVGGKTLDKIGVTATEVVLTVDGDPKSPVKVASSALVIDSSEGSMLFDRAEGKIIQRQSKSRIKGDITLEAGGNLIPSTLDLTIESDVKEQPVDAKP